MMKAHVVDEQVIEFREIDIADIPEHKRDLWRPVVYEGEGNSEKVIVEAGRVRVERSYVGDIEVHRSLYLMRVDRAFADIIAENEAVARMHREKFDEAQGVDRLGQDEANKLSEADSVENYPILSASLGIDGDNLWDVAQLVIDRAEDKVSRMHGPEKMRRKAKRAIRNAGSFDEIVSAYASINWGG